MFDSVVTLPSVPLKEPGAQVGTPTYEVRAAIESRTLRRMLLRRFLPPAEGSVRYTIQRPAPDQGRPPAVRIQYSGLAARKYAFLAQIMMPDHWDATAIADLIWYTLRYRYVELLRQQWITDTDVRWELEQLEPPDFFAHLFTWPDPLFSPFHRGGPFERKPCDEGWEIDPFGAPEGALILGPFKCYFGLGLLVLLNGRELRPYRPDLFTALAYVSVEFQTPDTFLVCKGSGGELALTTGDASPFCSTRGEVVWSDQHGRHVEIWRLHPEAVKRAIPISLASAPTQAG